jgi:hypothetical protein
MHGSTASTVQSINRLLLSDALRAKAMRCVAGNWKLTSSIRRPIAGNHL